MFELAYWQRAIRDPVILSGLCVDFLPIFAVLFMGWGALELVLLYWLENVVIGFVTLSRIFISGFGQGKVSTSFHSIFFGAFFTIHYGGFCLAHAMALLSLIGSGQELFVADGGEVASALSMQSFLGLAFILVAIILWQFYMHVVEFIRRSEYLKTDPGNELFAPYGRIVVLHIAIFAGVFAMEKYGEPMIGVLALILFRAAFGIVMNVFTREKRKAIV